MIVQPEHLRVDVAFSGSRAEASHDAVCPMIGPICDVRPEPPQQHHTTIWLGELRALAEYGVSSGLALQASLPLRIVGTSTRYTDLEGNAIELDYESIHHRDETLVGPGDAQLLAHAGRRLGGIDFGLRLGLSLPTGKVHEDPFRLGAEGRSHQHVQLGTGTFDPIAGVDASRSFGELTLSLFGLTQLPLYEGPQGYRAGARFFAGGAASHARGGGRVSLRLAGSVLHELAERWNGETPTDDGNQGRTDVYVGPGATVALGDDWTVSLDARVRAYGHAENAQLDLPLLVDLGAGTLLHLESGAHEEEPDALGARRPGDVADLVISGEARPLRAVPGKWTVLDFWASWCEACAPLDRRLRALAAARDDVAIRRVNVVDFDSPIAARELRGVSSLPHVRLLDPSGRVVFSKSGGPEALLGEIEARLP